MFGRSKATARSAPPAHQDRFWDETVRLPGLFERYREELDHANATACFGRLARGRYHQAVNRPNYNPARRSIVSFFQPKSGGTYLHNRLLSMGYQEFWWLFSNRNNDTKCYASDEALQYFLTGGFTCHTHCQPDPNILVALDRAGVDRIWIHLRNPAECAVSLFHHFLGEGQGEGEIGEQRRRHALEVASSHGLHAGMTQSEFVVAKIGWCTEWVAQWLRFAQEHPESVVLSFYQELGEPQAMFQRVFNELNMHLPGAVSAAPSPQDRYRKKYTNDWRHDLTSTAQVYVERRVRADLEEFPAFARLWS